MNSKQVEALLMYYAWGLIDLSDYFNKKELMKLGLWKK